MAQYRQFWEGSLDRLDAYLQQLQAVEKAQDSAKQAQAAEPIVNLNPAKKPRNPKQATSKTKPERKAP
jgi:hypothetical protein